MKYLIFLSIALGSSMDLFSAQVAKNSENIGSISPVITIELMQESISPSNASLALHAISRNKALFAHIEQNAQKPGFVNIAKQYLKLADLNGGHLTAEQYSRMIKEIDKLPRHVAHEKNKTRFREQDELKEHVPSYDEAIASDIEL